MTAELTSQNRDVGLGRVQLAEGRLKSGIDGEHEASSQRLI